MPWYILCLLVLGPLAIVGALFLAFHVLTLVTGIAGQAPGWRIRCTECDTTRDAGQAGVFRIGACSVGKVMFGYCKSCRGFRWIALERQPTGEIGDAATGA